MILRQRDIEPLVIPHPRFADEMAVKAGIRARDLAAGRRAETQPGAVADRIRAQQHPFGLGMDVARAQFGGRLVSAGREQGRGCPHGHLAVHVPRSCPGHRAILVLQQRGGFRLEDDEAAMLFDQVRAAADMGVDVDLIPLAVEHVDPGRHLDAAATQPGNRRGIGVEHDTGERRITPAVQFDLLARRRGPEHAPRQQSRSAQRCRFLDDDHARPARRGPAGCGHSRHATADDQQVARDCRFISHGAFRCARTWFRLAAAPLAARRRR